jgi:two-component system OmpR family response regulator
MASSLRPSLRDQQSFCLTNLGEQELQGGSTTLSPDELDLLVRIDPGLTVSQLRVATGLDPLAFDRLFSRLESVHLIAPVMQDTFGWQLQAELDTFVLANGAEEAEAGVRSLQRSGYLVRIARRRPGAAPARPERPLHVVLVEDDSHLAKFVSSYLSFDGFQVRVASTRQEALDELRKPPLPDLVLLDVMLPDVNGFDILASLRKHPAYERVPVMMITGKATREAVLKGMAWGANGYITKPFEPESLMKAVRTVLGWPEPEGGGRGRR